jgi:hypothetical protein
MARVPLTTVVYVCRGTVVSIVVGTPLKVVMTLVGLPLSARALVEPPIVIVT